MEKLLLIAILIPVIGGGLIPLAGFKVNEDNRGRLGEKARNIYIEVVALLTSALVWYLILNSPSENLVFARFTRDISLSLRIDGMSRIFAGLIAFLWPLALLYSFEYMMKEKNTNIFFMFYTMTYGVTLGIAFAEDIFTMYFFYELLTLVTVPLVMHTLTREAILASRTYLYYSLGGAGFAFIGLVFIITYSTNINFVYGGVLNPLLVAGRTDVLLLIYVLSFMGFGVKAAIFPLVGWLPKASVAPTPVTALLHAVAVVNAGAFAIIRLTYFSFGSAFLKGTWAQTTVMAFSLITILYSSSKALKETHLKRRLAYSTSSNLSYILFGVTLMTSAGLTGALLHFVIHALIKICSFLCAGAIIHESGKTYIHQLNGLAKKMPLVFLVFSLSALSLMGVPGFAGFISKWYLATGAVKQGSPLALAGIFVLLISSLFTAIYMFTIVIRGYWPEKDACIPEKQEAEVSVSEEDIHDPNWKMLLPLGLCALLMMTIGLFSDPLVRIISRVAGI